jgi:hypothetical protein
VTACQASGVTLEETAARMKRHAGLIDTEGPSIAAAVDDRLDSLGEAFGDYYPRSHS